MILWLGDNPEVVIALFSIISGGVGWCIKSLQGVNKSNKLQQEALKIILRRELKTLVNHCSDKGHANDSEMKEFIDTYNVYESLYGYNGYSSALYDEMVDLFERSKAR